MPRDDCEVDHACPEGIAVVSSKFRFREIDWLFYFPEKGNAGREYANYRVWYRDRKRGISQRGPQATLEDVLADSDIESNYPHTIDYYFYATGRRSTYTPYIIETRIVTSRDDFYCFLEELEL
ncbi:MAG: hypothetical protein NWE83_04965 [Candidatus Bathyarchaeota archaeon]|nr:hypothetical protein [Candidatus Bathyarchaeota archaeon]